MAEAEQHRQRRGERIAKAIARAGLASRREAEQWIVAGRVAVNGAPIASPAVNVTERDRITVDGAPLPQRERTRLFLYHKPRGLLTTRADPRGRPTIFERLPANLPRLISVGRLDFNTEGLLLLTNDGALARALELPATGWLRRYRVRAHGSVNGAVTQADLDPLRQGVTISGIHYGAIDARLERVQGSNLWLSFAIREGKNREVRNVLGHLGLDVTRLIRVSFGPFQLGELAEGAVEEVRTRTLREQLGARIIAQSGADFSTPVAARPAPPAPSRPGIKRGTGSQKSSRPKPTSHSWRAPDESRPEKPLRRKFHGARRGREQDQEKARAATSGEAHAGLITDRKGRPVTVERHGKRDREAPAPESRRNEKAFAKRGRQRPRRAFDRAGGARPRHPRGKG